MRDSICMLVYNTTYIILRNVHAVWLVSSPGTSTPAAATLAGPIPSIHAEFPQMRDSALGLGSSIVQLHCRTTTNSDEDVVSKNQVNYIFELQIARRTFIIPVGFACTSWQRPRNAESFSSLSRMSYSAWHHACANSFKRGATIEGCISPIRPIETAAFS